MSKLITYLTFNGNCRDAMNFYQRCLGGKLYFQTVGDSPKTEDLPDEIKDKILHASLQNGQLMLMATDMVSEEGVRQGNTVSILLSCKDLYEMRTYYKRLSEGARQTSPIEETHWGGYFGGLTDRYGNHWLILLNNPVENYKTTKINA